MKNSLARFREAGSFIAGLVIGIAIVLSGFAMMDSDLSDWQTLWFLGAPIILALGLTLQVVVTTKPRHRRTTDPELGALPVGFLESSHDRWNNTSQRQSLARIA